MLNSHFGIGLERHTCPGTVLGWIAVILPCTTQSATATLWATGSPGMEIYPDVDEVQQSTIAATKNANFVFMGLPWLGRNISCNESAFATIGRRFSHFISPRPSANLPFPHPCYDVHVRIVKITTERGAD